MGDVCFDVVRAILNDGPVAGVKLCVLGHPFCEGSIIVVHFLEAGHVRSEILENRGSIAEDGVCREESFVGWEVDGYGIGGVTRCGEEVDGSEVGVRGITLVGSN